MQRRQFESRNGSHWRYHETQLRAVVDPASRSPLRIVYLVIVMVVLAVAAPIIGIIARPGKKQ